MERGIVSGTPKVSIGMPVYNGERLLPETLDSILAQTFPDFELVISDNASTDATPEICRRYMDRDSRIRYERNATNIGIIANHNRTFRLSRAPYFKWQAHDDLLAPEFLERCVAILDEDQTTVLVGTRVALVDEHGAALPFDATKGMYVTEDGEEIPRPAGTDMLASHERIKRFGSVLTDVAGPVYTEFVYGLFRSDALRRTMLNEGYIGAEKVLLSRLSLMGRFREVPMELFVRRYHPGHAGRTGRSRWKGAIDIAKSYDPDRRVILFPLMRQVRGYLRAITDADITTAEKMRCALMVVNKVATVGWRRVTSLPTRVQGAAERARASR
jgi:glycosyltransferase involved in cell wall biosynthesis